MGTGELFARASIRVAARAAAFCAAMSGATCSSPDRACTDAADCPAGTTCREHACVPLCNSDSDCGADAPHCYAGVCQAHAPEPCSAASECTSPGPCEIAAGAFCEGSRCVYASRICDDPPADECAEGDTLFLSYPARGECTAAGDCVYAPSETPCIGCRANCLQVCAGVVCNDTRGGCRSGGTCLPNEPPECAYVPEPDLTPCLLAAAGGAGVCLAGDCVRCLEDGDCDDANPCTLDSCVARSCELALAGSIACDDGDACTTDDTCAADWCSGVAVSEGEPCVNADGYCVGGVCRECTSALHCDDGNGCTDDVCDPGGRCSHTRLPDGSACATCATCSEGICGVVAAGLKGPDCATTCRQCDGAASCVLVAQGLQDSGCDAPATDCSRADACDGVGSCDLGHLAIGDEGGCPPCQDCYDGTCSAVLAGQTDVGCDAPASACSAADSCDSTGACNANDLASGEAGGCPTCQECDGAGACAPLGAGAQAPGCEAACQSCDGAGGCSCDPSIGLPLGAVLPYAGDELPAGWFWADGACLDADVYPELFGSIGHSFGGAGGTFCLPDLSGRFALGATPSYPLATSGGSDSAPGLSLPVHDHTVGWADHDHAAGAWPPHEHNSAAVPSGAFVDNTGTYSGPGPGPFYLDWGCEPACNEGWARSTLGGPGTVRTGQAVQSAVVSGSELPPYHAVGYIVKAAPEAETPRCAIYGFAAPPAGAVPADGRVASGDLADCLAAALAGALPDLQGRFLRGQLGGGLTEFGGSSGHRLRAAISDAPHTVSVAHTHQLTEPLFTVSGGAGPWHTPSSAAVSPFYNLGAQCCASDSGYFNGQSPRQTQTSSGNSPASVQTSTNTVATVDSSAAEPPWMALALAMFERAAEPGAGTIVPFAGSGAPPGWLAADGACRAAADFADLFAAVGYAFGGSGDTFCLPDLRGRFVIGADGMVAAGASGGELDHRHTFSVAHTHIADMPSHTHAWSFGDHTHGIQIRGASTYSTAGSWPLALSGDYSTYGGGAATIGSRSEGAQSVTSGPSSVSAVATEPSNPPFLSLGYIIKY